MLLSELSPVSLHVVVVTMIYNTDVHARAHASVCCMVHTCGEYATCALAHVLGMVTCEHACTLYKVYGMFVA